MTIPLIRPLIGHFPSNISDAQINSGHFGAKFGEGVDRCKPIFNAIWERHEAIVRKRNLLPFEYNARMCRDRQRDRETDRQTAERSAISPKS